MITHPTFKSEALMELYLVHLKHKQDKYPLSWEIQHCNYLDKYKGKKPANRLTSMICDFLNYSGHQAERISTTGIYRDQSKIVTDVVGFRRKIGSGFWSRSQSTPGSADISATINGKSVKIEVKIKDKQSEVQKEYQKSIEKAGGLYYIVHDFEEFYKIYNDITANN